MKKIAALLLVLALGAAGALACWDTHGPRGGIDYSVTPPAGEAPAGNPDTHTGDGILKASGVLLSTLDSVTTIWGYAHRGYTGESQADANDLVDEVKFYLLEDADVDGTSDEAATTAWTLVHSYEPSAGDGDVTGWGHGAFGNVLDGTFTAWESQDVLQGTITGLVSGKAYFLLIQVTSNGLTNTMPQNSAGYVTGPEEFTTASVDIADAGNGGAIDSHEVIWFRVNKTPAGPTPPGG